MSSKLDESDFVDRDLEAMQESGTPSFGADDSTATTPLSQEELTSRVTEKQQKLAELKREQEEIEREKNELLEARKARKRENELQEASKREYELTTDPTLTNGPTFWFKHAWWIIIFVIFALGVLINWITDGELITWLEPSR